MRSLNIKAAPSNYFCFHARSFSPVEIQNQIEVILKEIPSTKALFLDGIADLMFSVNDEVEANKLGIMLANVADIHGIGIIAVIHDNQSNGRARGHLGSMLQRKAESFLRLSIGKGVLNVSFEYCRNAASPNRLQLQFNKDTMLLEKAQGLSEENTDYDILLLRCCFKNEATIDYSLLIQRIQDLKGIGQSAAKKRISSYKNSGLLIQPENGKYSFNA